MLVRVFILALSFCFLFSFPSWASFLKNPILKFDRPALGLNFVEKGFIMSRNPDLYAWISSCIPNVSTAFELKREPRYAHLATLEDPEAFADPNPARPFAYTGLLQLLETDLNFNPAFAGLLLIGHLKDGRCQLFSMSPVYNEFTLYMPFPIAREMGRLFLSYRRSFPPPSEDPLDEISYEVDGNTSFCLISAELVDFYEPEELKDCVVLPPRRPVWSSP